MKTLEFEASIGGDRVLHVPPEIAEQIGNKEPVRVILVVSDDEGEAQTWSQLTAEQFVKGYDETDAIYDHLPAR
jgi:hypothetical protein